MMRPGFRPSAEAPTTTALFGVSSRFSSATGRAGGRAFGRCSRARPSSATRRPSSAATIGFTSSSARPRPSGGSNPAHRSASRARATASPASRSSASPAPRLVRSRPVSAACTSVPRSARSASLAGEAAGGHHRARLLGAQGAEQGLGVEPAHPEDDHRAEGGVVAEGGQHLAPGAGAEAHPLDDEHAVETRRGARRRGPRPARAPPPRAARPARCGTRRRRPRRSCGGGRGRRS